MIAYPAKFAPEENGAFTVTFPDIPEAITCGDSAHEAMAMAVDALETVLSEYIRRRREIPKASKSGRGMRVVVLPALAEAKVQLYQTMRAEGVRKAEMARRAGWHKSQMDRLLDLTHDSRL